MALYLPCTSMRGKTLELLKIRIRNAILTGIANAVHLLGRRTLGKTGFFTDLLHVGLQEWIRVYKEHFPNRISDLDRSYSLLRSELTGDFNWMFGPCRVRAVADQLRQVLHPISSGDEITFLDLGCGTHNPLGLSSVMYLNGARRAIALDLHEPDRPRSAVALYDLLVECWTNWEKWNWGGTDESTLQDRLARFHLDELKNGQMEEGITDVPISHYVGDILDAPFPEGSIDIMTSHLVLEHFLNFRDAMYTLFHLTAPGGLGAHWIDLSDHRRYLDPGRYHHWSFLAEDDNWSDGRCNRLRAGEIRQICETVGFEVVRFDCTRIDMPPGFGSRLTQRYRAMSPDDLSTVSVLAVLRRPNNR